MYRCVCIYIYICPFLQQVTISVLHYDSLVDTYTDFRISYMSPDIGIALLPPRESGNHRPVISTLMDQEGLLPPVRFGEFTAMYGKSEAKECSGTQVLFTKNPGNCGK